MIRLFRVRGQSMKPDYRDGDLAVALSASWDRLMGRQPRGGDDVVARHPNFGLVLKRLESIGEDGVRLRGLSNLSAEPEFLRLKSKADVVGRVVWRF